MARIKALFSIWLNEGKMRVFSISPNLLSVFLWNGNKICFSHHAFQCSNITWFSNELLTITVGMINLSFLLNDSMSLMSSSDSLKSNTCVQKRAIKILNNLDAIFFWLYQSRSTYSNHTNEITLQGTLFFEYWPKLLLEHLISG